MAPPLIFGNLLSLNAQDVETSSAGWAPNFNCAVAQSTSGTSYTGIDPTGLFSLKMTSTAGGEMAALNTGGQFSVAPGASYLISAWSLAATVGRLCAISVNWYSAGPTFLQASPWQFATNNTSTWTQLVGEITAPLLPTPATLGLFIPDVQVTGGASEVHFFDVMSIIPVGSTSAFKNASWW